MSKWPVQDLGAFLTGEWRLARVVDDRRANLRGRFRGRAIFRPIDGGLAYRESGLLRFGNYCDVAQQTYIYRLLDQSRAEVRFRDGQSFHVLDLSTGDWIAPHICESDRYDGRFCVRDGNVFEVRWTIAGPRKDLTVVSRLRRRVTAARAGWLQRGARHAPLPSR